MSIRRLNVFPERNDFIVETEFAGRKRRFRLFWREGTRTWYLSVSNMDGTRIISGVAIRAGGEPLNYVGLQEFNDSAILFVGEDYDYPEALGDVVDVWLVDA